MEAQDFVISYVIWKEVASLLFQDSVIVGSSQLKLTHGYEHLLVFLREVALSMEKAALVDMRRKDIRMLAVEEDRGELFILWKHRGKNKMERVKIPYIRRCAQEKMEELVKTMNNRMN
ncbi:hypothetical protein [Brevibacillus daliensis]|uniref:hypothetical protein n=1 Tax=Brevibacillus daliensis TaxID=2892995 RepID=UPI001E384564|nr:hypothetical protein [Brevibacillus daliensis]